MNLIVFAGPSLGIPDRKWSGPIDFRPPAAQGDIARATLCRPAAIGLIDGCFATTASVWHKEIIYALSEQICMFGAASMGALRAVELAPFGMIGIGGVFRAYRDGITEDDDDVAVLHGPAELGYMNLSEPMVNVWATVNAAYLCRIIAAPDAINLIKVGKSIYYVDRTWKAILAKAQEIDQLSSVVVDRLRGWLPNNKVDIKRRDALELVYTMLAWRPSSRSTVVVSNSVFWHEFCQSLSQSS